ncbi:FAD-binding protein [Brenneria goodwinii]|uniref:FAD-binding protein n=1 Tax=Brenneria goodwinii TaxID=1109412 RepID=UPI0036F196FB
MALIISQNTLDQLTDVEMPKHTAARQPDETLALGSGATIPVYRCETLVVGSGAAGLRAAVELKRRQVDVLVATQTLFWGTSACSGSDKQTLHTAATSNRGDNFIQLANALSAGGAMDADTAYVEAVGSIEAFAGLKYIGLPLPEDRYGATLRYQTDHDEAGRATSCGPRTSRLMVKVLAEEANRLAVPFVDHSTVIRLLIDDRYDERRIAGALAINTGARGEHNPAGLALYLCPSLVLAAGGPGELFRDSVYPNRCFGSLGLGLEAGIQAVNLTENQFGIGTRRDEFPWNLSGTYVQCMPYIFSLDEQGEEHNFLADYYRSTQELASNIFRKGYQWPIHATRMLNFGSSLVDLAIFSESQLGRTIYMDFNRNPQPVPGDRPFSLNELDDDVAQYLTNNEALLTMPFDRLRRMNPLAIELYKHHGHDISTTPLPFNVNHQHMNGGLAVDRWGQTSLAGCFAVGEAAGTHGVTRPGGAALNAGQVFGMRCARQIASQETIAPVPLAGLLRQITDCAQEITAGMHNENGLAISDIKREIQQRMSDKAGFICHADDVKEALLAARRLNEQIRERGVAIPFVNKVAVSFQWRHMALASEAVLSALDFYISQGGGSRGARAICSPRGEETPTTRAGALEQYRFLTEKPEHKQQQLFVRYRPSGFSVTPKPLRSLGDLDAIFFEKNWPDFLTGEIYR